MSTRVTSSMLSANYLRNMSTNLKNMKTLQNQLASGKEIQRISDNPYKASRTMQLNTEISYNKQYNENIKDTSNWLDTTDTALSQMGTVFGRIETLLVNAGNGTYSDDERAAIQDEVKEKVNELSQLLNTSFDGSYIFGGTKTGSKPTTVDANGKLQYADKEGKTIDTYINVAGEVTNSSVSTNTILTSGDIYLDTNGKITTSSSAKDGTDNIQIIQSNSLYLDADGNITTTSKASDGTTNESILLKDTLYSDLKGNVTTSKTSENKLITSDDELYYYEDSAGNVTTLSSSENKLMKTLYKDADGSITTTVTANPISSNDTLYLDADNNVTTLAVSSTGTANTLMSSGNTLYVGSDGKVTISDKLADGTANTLISSPKFLYKDSSGKVTSTVTANPISSSDTLYLDADNNVTTSPTSSTGAANTIIPSSDDLYVDSNGNVKTSATSQNTLIPTGKSLYSDSNGKITTSATSTLIKSGDSLYVDIKGNVTTSAVTINNKLTGTLFYDNDNNLTTEEYDKDGNPYNQVEADSNLYIDAKGDVTISSTSDGTANKVIILNDSLYVDSENNVKASKYGTTVPAGSTLITTGDTLYTDKEGKLTSSSKTTAGEDNTKIILGDSLYLDNDGNITTSPTTQNTLITSSDSLYVDSEGNVTTSANSADGTANKQITSDDELYEDADGNITTTSTGTLLETGQPLYADKSGKIISSSTTNNTELTTSDKIYVDDAKNLTMSSTTKNQALTMSDIKNLKIELQSSSVTEERKTEINKILNNDSVAQLVQLDWDLQVDISQGVKTNYNKTAVDVLQFTDKSGKSINVSDLLSDIINNLGSSDATKTNQLSSRNLADIQSVTANLLRQRSEVGSLQNRMESAQSNNETENYNMTDILSKTEDIDFTEKTMEYATMQTTYTAALQVSAKILPMSILNYL